MSGSEKNPYHASQAYNNANLSAWAVARDLYSLFTQSVSDGVFLEDMVFTMKDWYLIKMST